jgi:tetratricopeptide (TPR) repeat protein
VGLRKALARSIREQGNALFTKGLYEEASDLYTKAIGYDDDEAVFPLNRAACLVKLSRFTEAEADCTRALELDCSNHKAFFRRGVSRAGLGDVDGAVGDFKEVLHLQREDANTFSELRKLSTQFLHQAAKKQGSKAALSTMQVESLLPTLQEANGEEEEDDMTNSNEGDFSSRQEDSSEDDASIDVQAVVDKTARMAPSVLEVFSQVSFAIAFSHVVKQQTGIKIKVPVTNWPAYSTLSSREKQ